MQKLNTPISNLQQLMPMDLIFSYSEETKLLPKILQKIRIYQFQKNHPDLDISLAYFNRVRMFWGLAFTNNEVVCLDWVRNPYTLKYSLKIEFLSSWVLDVENAWILRSANLVRTGMNNRGGFENIIGKYYVKGELTTPSKDIFKMYQQAGSALPGNEDTNANISDLLIAPTLVLINGK